jgi:hypothetical protein
MRIIPIITQPGGSMPLFEIGMRVRIRDQSPDTPMGMWGDAGEVVGVNFVSVLHGESIDNAQQVYTVQFDGESKPMKVFETWLQQDFG